MAQHSYRGNTRTRAGRSPAGRFPSVCAFLCCSFALSLCPLALWSVRANPLQNRRTDRLDVMAVAVAGTPADLHCGEGGVMTPPEALVNGCQLVGRLLPEVQQCRLSGQQKPRGLTLLGVLRNTPPPP